MFAASTSWMEPTGFKLKPLFINSLTTAGLAERTRPREASKEEKASQESPENHRRREEMNHGEAGKCVGNDFSGGFDEIVNQHHDRLDGAENTFI